MNREAAQRYQADISSGLSQEQVQERNDSGWTNEMVTEESKTVGQIIKGNLLTYFNLIFAILAILFVQQYVFSGASFQSSILSMVAAVVGMIPEGLYLLASVALVVSVIRLASQKVLVHDMKCIESLARVDVLCVDKTGTITENEMQVSSVIPMEGFDPTQGVGLKAQISTLIAAMPEGNLTMQALKRYFKTPLKKNAEAVFPFSSTYKYCAAVFPDNAYVLGAPELVLRSDYEKYRPLMESYSADGFRTGHA